MFQTGESRMARRSVLLIIVCHKRQKRSTDELDFWWIVYYASRHAWTLNIIGLRLRDSLLRSKWNWIHGSTPHEHICAGLVNVSEWMRLTVWRPSRLTTHKWTTIATEPNVELNNRAQPQMKCNYLWVFAVIRRYGSCGCRWCFHVLLL